MREIKFRAWDKELKEMTEPWTIRREGQFVIPKWAWQISQKDFDIMQFTGLKDMNGKEVYEGDIVEVEHPRMMGYVGPRWKEVAKDLIKERFTVEYRAKNTIDGGFGAFYLSGEIHIDYVTTGKVIGNIYKNKEQSED